MLKKKSRKNIITNKDLLYTHADNTKCIGNQKLLT